MKKKILWGLGILGFLFLATAIVVPLVVDVDQFRPQIVDVANQNLNGKLTLGKLKLSLWGKIKIRAEGFSLEDRSGKKLVSVKEVYFHLPLFSLLTGSPSVIIHMDTPDFWVSRNSKGDWNILELLPKGTGASADKPEVAKSATPEKSGSGTSGSSTMPGFLVGARLGLDIRNLHLVYDDQLAKVQTEIKDLNIEGKDLSLSRPMSLKIWSDLKSTLTDAAGTPTFSLHGPIEFSMKGKPETAAGIFQKVDLQIRLSVTDLDIEKPGVFHKKKGVPAEFEGEVGVSPTELSIKNAELRFHTLRLGAKGRVKTGTSTELDLGFEIPKTPMKPFGELFPAVPSSGFGGSVEANLKVKGPVERIGIDGFLRLDEFLVRHALLKETLRVDADLSFQSDRMDKIAVVLQAPKNKLEVKGSLISFQAPQINLQVTSPGLDLDSLLNTPKNEEKKDSKKAAPSEEKAGTATKAAPSMDQEMAMIRNNPVLAKSALQLNIDIQSLVSKGAKIEKIKSQLYFKNLVAGVSSFSLNAFNGSLASKGSIDFKPALPQYDFSAAVSRFDLQKAVESQMPSLKNTVIGNLSFQANGNGKSLDPDKALKNFNLKGNFSITDAQFATIDVAKMASEAIEKSLSKVSEKVPGIKDKVGKKLSDRESKYDKMSGTFTMASGIFSAPDFFAQSAKDQGVDLKGATRLDLVQQKIDAKWWVIDTWNRTGAESVGFEVSGTTVPKVLAEKGQPVQFPVTVGCELTKPCYNYSEVPEHFVKVAVKNTTSAVKDRVKQEAKDKVKDVIKEQGKDLLKKFF